MRYLKGLFFTACMAWFSYGASAENAKNSNQLPSLIAFLGSEWSVHSRKLSQELLDSPEFALAFDQKIHLVRVEIPKQLEDALPNAKALQEKFGITKCPTLVLVSPFGQIARFENLPKNPQSAIGKIQKALESYTTLATLDQKNLKNLKVDQIQHYYHLAQNLVDSPLQQSLLQAGLKADRGTHFMLEKYGQMLLGSGEPKRMDRFRRKIISKNPSDPEVAEKLAILDFEAKSHKQGMGINEVISPLVDYIRTYQMSGAKHVWKIQMKIAQYLVGKGHVQRALQYAKASYEVAPKQEKESIAEAIDYLQNIHAQEG